jgi:PleD family two-component response regulator
MDEEISRAERSGTALSCLLVAIGNAEELSYAHGEEFVGEALAFIAGVLAAELRPFDRIGQASAEELLLLLPGADGPRGEIVARRMLRRLRSVKVEADGARRALHILIGLATWTREESATDLLGQARAAVRREHLARSATGPAGPPPPVGRDGPS